jgi:hypothetical protein
MYDLRSVVNRTPVPRTLCLWAITFGLITPSLWAQPARHPLFNIRSPVGQLGRTQATFRPGLAGYFQPVLVKVPGSATIAVGESGAFGVQEFGKTLVGLQVGEVYRFQIDNIPFTTSRLYPTVELIDRMHPPAGKETRYPIPIEIAPEDIALALAGKFVTRVVYVEDPLNAMPVRELPTQRYFEVMAHEDPLHVADELGRPVAILRMGTLAPGPNGPTDEFLFGSPPLQRYAAPAERPYVPSDLGPEDIPVEVDRSPQPPAAPETAPPAGSEETIAAPDEPSNAGDVPPNEEISPSDTDNLFDEPALDAPDDATDLDDDNPFGDI